MIPACAGKGGDTEAENKIRITFLIVPTGSLLHLQVGKRESLDRLRGDSHHGMHFPSGARVMTISAISSFSASQTSNYQNYRQAFSQLTNALQSGNLSAAQNAYDTLASSPAAQGNGPFAQALQQIGQDLQSGDLGDAQQALASLQQQQQAHGHHHHHGGGDISGASNSTQAQDTNASDPNNDNDADGISIDIQVTATFDSSNKVDIKA
jgi:hypothetical protein